MTIRLYQYVIEVLGTNEIVEEPPVESSGAVNNNTKNALMLGVG